MYNIYLIPQSHYDVVWAFTEEEYYKINEIIIQDAIKLIERSDFKFCIEQTYLLELMEERNPTLWEKVRQLIKEGKFGIIDGMYMMPDMMLPRGEVLVRQILFGKRYLRERFNLEVPVAWAADSFGMNAQLPQIYAKSGYRWLVFRRGAPSDIRESEFIWRGLDGSTILTHWMPYGYRAGLVIEDWGETFVNLRKFAATANILMPCGSGSTPPQPETSEAVDKWNQNHTDSRMTIAMPDEFFREMEKHRDSLTTVQGEFYDDELADVFPQVCSSRAWVMQEYRQCEIMMLQSETLATIAWLLGAPYPKKELRKAWEKTLFATFHDVIAGCGVDEVYTDVRIMFGSLKASLEKLHSQSLRYIAGQVGCDRHTTIAFNLLPWPVGNYIIPGDEGIHPEELPALGYTTLKPPQDRPEPEGEFTVEGSHIETPFWSADVDDQNGFVSIADHDGNLLVQGNEILIEDEVGDLYRHKSRYTPELINAEAGEGFPYGIFKPKGFRIEVDSTRAKIVYESEYYCLTWPYRMKDKFGVTMYKYKALDIRKEITFYRNLPRIDFKTWIDNKYPNVRLRIRFDTGIEKNTFHRETQFGVITELTQHYTSGKDSTPSGIPTFLTWFDISDGVRGITFMNRGMPAVDINEGNVYVTLLRSVSGLSADGSAGPLVPTPDALELAAYTFEYALEPHDGDWRETKMYKPALEYQQPPIPVPGGGWGHLPTEMSFLKLSPDNMILSGLKKAEDSDSVILRFYETRGEETLAEIIFFRNIRRASRVDLMENEEQTIGFSENYCKVAVAPFEIVSLKLEFETPATA
jgi:alpha-mannosidase